MTSASELFCNRRSRYGRNSLEIGPDSSSSFDRISHHHHHYHSNHDSRRLNHHNHSNRRERFDPDGCDLPRRPSHHLRHPINRPSQPERDLIRPDQIGIQSSSGNVTHSEDSRNVRNRQRVTGNDRLPGAVLLARERLLERLRGVSVSGNRQSRELSFNIDHDDFTLGRGGSYVGLEDVGTDYSREDFLAEVTAYTYPRPSVSLVASQEIRKRPAGLTRDSLDRLHVEVFNNTETSDERMSSRDCSICLEMFRDGDVVTCLPCEHKFHPCCLDPWVKACGDCPNCRTTIDVSAYKDGENL